MESHFVINVAQRNSTTGRYGHLFATASHSCVTGWEMEEVYKAINTRFPAPEFKVEVSRVLVSMVSVSMEGK